MVQSVLAYRFGLWTYCSIKEGVLADMVSSKIKCCLQRTSAKCQQVLTNNKQSGSNGWIFLLDRYCCCIGGSLALWNGDIQCVILDLLLQVFVRLLLVVFHTICC